MSRHLLIWSATLIAAAAPAAAFAQDVVRTGPPPEIRALVDSVMKAANSGNATAWEALAKERFSTDLLKRQTVDERRKGYERMRADLGTLTFERAMRQGPDAPLDLHVTGSTGATAVISIDISEDNPPKITGLRIAVGGQGRPPREGGSTLAPPINGRMTDDEIGQALDAHLTALAAADTFSGVALVARNGRPVFQKAYGLADRARKIQNTMATRFNIGSINKAFTQLAVEQLITAGILAATDTLGKFFPDYPQAGSRPATVAQLLNHTAGLADFFGPQFTQAAKDRFRSNADYFRFVGSLPPAFEPGARNQYCNGCYIALGAIVEKVAGVPYEQYVTQHIFLPAGMTGTGYPQVDAIEPEVAIGYTRRGADATLRSSVYLHGATGSAAGGGYSTAGDLLAYVSARRDGRLPKDSGTMGIAGGAPGTSAVVEQIGVWTVIVLSNLDPPTGERLGVAIAEALNR